MEHSKIPDLAVSIIEEFINEPVEKELTHTNKTSNGKK
jgi:hypothetical protein